MQHSVFLTCNFLQKVLAKNTQAFHLMKDVSESLAGRVGIIILLGLSNSEISGVTSEVFSTDSKHLISLFIVK
ncbi:hypothetical protein DOZ58_06790 [Acetobacterium sp. KB-1]|nr:hypothetical protein DOZ58_06790 [Acetobacterium sp. KB-1]